MKQFFPIVIVALLSASCENYYVEKQLKHSSAITDVRTFSYSLLDSDYPAIAKDPVNIGIALAVGDDSVTYYALQQVGSMKAFNEIASADVFVPNFIYHKYPQLSKGSLCDIQYTLYEGKEKYLEPFDNVLVYELSKNDYKSIWGKQWTTFLTPKTVATLPQYLAEAFPKADVGKIIALRYQYQSSEPDTLYEDLPYVCTIGQLLRAKETVEHQISGRVGLVKSTIYGRYYMVDGNDSIYVNGLTDEDGNKVWKTLGIETGDSITIKGKYSESEAGEALFSQAVYLSHRSPDLKAKALRKAVKVPDATNEPTLVVALYQLTLDGWAVYTNEDVKGTLVLPDEVYTALGSSTVSDPQKTINTYLTGLYPYAAAEDKYVVMYQGSSSTTADLFISDGYTFVMQTGYVTENMAFQLKNNWEADISTYYSEPFIGHGQGDFTIQNIELDGLNYVWAYSTLYGMKASAYASSTNHTTESWLVSPGIRLKKAIHPALLFDQASKFAADFATECTVWVSTDYAGDVTSCKWVQLPWLMKEDGTGLNVPDGTSWTFQSSGEMPLTEYVNQTISIGFRYTSTAAASATWEIKNFLVHEVLDVQEETTE